MLSGYRIQSEIFRGKSRVVYRGVREKDGIPVLIKTFVNQVPESSELVDLKREYEIISSLSIPGIVRPLSLERFGNGLALILHDSGGSTLRQLMDSSTPLQAPPCVTNEIGRNFSLVAFLNVAIRLADIVGKLHQNRIMHKDINPKNIVLNLEQNQVELIDFSISSRLPREDQKMLHPDLLEGTLAYISPEQTGRMNRILDYRTDFYSLGITFYEMVTGKLPFYSTDPLEMVHSHIARNPAPPSRVNPNLTPAISDVVMKLLAKTAEERYRSAAGLKTDLEFILDRTQRGQTLDDFVPGFNEVSDQFNIPQKLYGRDPEIRLLLDGFDHVCTGIVEMMLVFGYSGIGKTSLIHEVHKPIVRQKGFFISGKFDQLNRIVPYSALIQAFQELVRQLLTEEKDKLQEWKSQLLLKLGPNGQLLIDVIPEMEWIIGRQEPVAELGPTESQNRFQFVFQQFLSVFATEEHPLVIFLDDLQWADSATLSLLKILIPSSDLHHLFLIGAYRDNEITPGHPLSIFLTELKKEGANLNSISLGPLGLSDLNQFVADTMQSSQTAIEPLASLVMKKTEGNPFFVTHFLKSLHLEDLIHFDEQKRQWRFDLQKIETREMTDNVVDLMASRIRQLPEPTQGALMLASCIGNRFDLDTLSTVQEKAIPETAKDLWQAILEGLILPTGRSHEFSDEIPSAEYTYRFLHDRVQQAAYHLIPVAERKTVHLKIGKLMLAHADATEMDEHLFDIANHLNLGIEQISNDALVHRLAELNLLAGVKAKNSTAYTTALNYLKTGKSLLPEDCWQIQYDFSFRLYQELAECEYLCGNFEAAEECFLLLLQNARSSVEAAMIHNLRIIQYENMARYTDAVSAAKEGLRLLEIQMPETDDEKQSGFQSELNEIRNLIGSRDIPELIHLPEMTNPERKMSMKLLMTAWAPAYIAGDGALYTWISARMVRLSLQHGNTNESAYGYVTHAITVGTGLGDYTTGYEFGRLALDVIEKFHDMKYRAKVHHMFSCFVNFWRKPISTCFVHSQEAYRSGLESGDFAYATYGIFHESWYGLIARNDIDQFLSTYSSNLTFLRQIKNYSFADTQQIILHWGLNLRGLTSSYQSLSSQSFQEQDFLKTYGGNPFFETFYYVPKLAVLFHFENFPEALECSRKADLVISALAGTIWPTLLCFYKGLVLAALNNRQDAVTQNEFVQKISEAKTQMKVWAENSPANFRHQYLLLSAELARIQDDSSHAKQFYNEAILAARETGLYQNEALAQELYGKFCFETGEEQKGKAHITESHYLYTTWGAAAKARYLQRKYLMASEKATESTAYTSALFTTHAPAGTLDAYAVVKAAQAISGEIILERLLETLMKIVLENAGAQRGLLIQETESRYQILVAGTVDHIEVFPEKTRFGFSHAVWNYVRRTGESIVLADAEKDTRFAGDRYVQTEKPKSMMCVPVLYQHKQVGVLYLENNLSTSAFTAERTQLVQMLASQSAISIENARLYEEMQQEITTRKKSQEELQRRADQFSALYETTRDLAAHHDLLSLLQIISDRAIQLVDAEGGGIYLFDSEHQELELVTVKGMSVSNGMRLKLEEGLAGHVAKTRSTLSVDDYSRWPHRSRQFEDIPIAAAAGVPMLYAGELIGVLSVNAPENSGRTFTAEDVRLLSLFGAHAASAVYNARLFHQTQLELAQRKQAEETLRSITEGTASVVGTDFFRSLVKHLADSLKVRYAFVAECIDKENTRVCTLAFWNGQGFAENVAWELAGTPCEHVIDGNVCHYPRDLQTLFPKDLPLVELNAHGYLGAPLFDSAGRIIGHVAVMDIKTMESRPQNVSILKIFAARAGVELERKRADEALRRSEQALREALIEVEQLKNRLEAENIYLQEEIRTEHNFTEIVGDSPAIRKVFANVERVARTDSTVLITGETGTGKELVARAIHQLSNRKDSALIKVNCAALPSGLIESELFGHEKGAFTGALSRKKGRFEVADGGTIFLDEVGELSLETQVKLLRVLQEQEFERIGSSQSLKVNVRVIAATNRKLEELVKSGSFRSDLFYRLNIFPIHIPPLFERREDIPTLTGHFVSNFSRRLGKKVNRIAPDAMEVLVQYSWPGNVRELANVLERAIILCDSGTLQKTDIGITEQVFESPQFPTLEDSQRVQILKALEKSDWVVGGPEGAARMLGLNRTTLLARMKKLNITRASR